MKIEFSNKTKNYLKILEEDDNILLTKMYVVSTGDSRPVSLDGKPCIVNFSLDSLKKGSKTLPNKPVICIWDCIKKDFTNHAMNYYEKTLIDVIGMIPETCDMEFEEVEGKTFLTCKVAFWKAYNSELVKKIAENTRNGKPTNLSMEIDVRDGHYENEQYFIVDDFIFIGVSLLGENISTGIADAKMDTIKFSAIHKDIINETNKFIINYNEMKGESKLLTNDQKYEILRNGMSEYKDEQGYERFWIRDFDDIYVYAEDYNDNYKTFRMKYNLNEETKTATVDVESKEEVIRGGYVTVGTTTMTYSEAIASCKKFESKCSELESSCKKLETACTDKETKCSEIEVKCSKLEKDLKEMETKFSEVNSQLETTKAEFSSVQTELTDLKKDSVVKYARLNELEVMFSEQESAKLLKQAEDIVDANKVYFSSEEEVKEMMNKFEEIRNEKDCITKFSSIVNDKVKPIVETQFNMLKQELENIKMNNGSTDNLQFAQVQLVNDSNTDNNTDCWAKLGYKG